MNGATLDETHDAALASWVESANDPATDFPIQNLPFGRFRSAARQPWRIGVAIGDRVLDLEAAGLLDTQDMNRLMAAGTMQRRALRLALSQGLRHGGEQRVRFAAALHAQSDVEMLLPDRDCRSPVFQPSGERHPEWSVAGPHVERPTAQRSDPSECS